MDSWTRLLGWSLVCIGPPPILFIFCSILLVSSAIPFARLLFRSSGICLPFGIFIYSLFSWFLMLTIRRPSPFGFSLRVLICFCVFLIFTTRPSSLLVFLFRLLLIPVDFWYLLVGRPLPSVFFLGICPPLCISGIYYSAVLPFLSSLFVYY